MDDNRAQIVLQYELPKNWILYDPIPIANALIEAKAAVMSLASMPYQRSWADALQEIELKREVAGTSKIEGADFTEEEFDRAISSEILPEQQLTRSQRQARAAINTYRWIAALAPDFPVTEDLISQVHRRIVTGCDDDHCAPGQFRSAGENVVFGRPRHRGVEGGKQCEDAFSALMNEFNTSYRAHDPLIQALALHYHMGALHPFYDGNGRTARAVEALLLRRASLKDALFVSMSNYYYDEKDAYLKCLSEVRANGHNLTSFLSFGLKGIAIQCNRLLVEIRRHIQITLYRDVLGQMYGRLRSTKKRALAQRQMAIALKLLSIDRRMDATSLFEEVAQQFVGLKAPFKAYIRDVNKLLELQALTLKVEDKKYFLSPRLEWATEITETAFFKQINTLPRAKTGISLHSIV